MPHATRPSYLRSLSSFTEKNKPRLYIALYPRGGDGRNTSSGCRGSCDSCHWALVIGPAPASRKGFATRYHLAHSSTLAASDSPIARKGSAVHAFCFEETSSEEASDVQATVLIRIAVAKVLDQELVGKILRSIGPPKQDGDYYTCFHWVREAFAALHAEPGCLKSYFDEDDWTEMEKCAREYYRSKRRDGRFANGAVGAWSSNEISTFNAWEKRETTA